jgi:signal transduction histidine kinase
MKPKSVKSINPFKSVIQICYDIVKAHGGELKVKSELDDFTEFSVILPL